MAIDTDEILAKVREQLSGAVGDELREVLIKADTDAGRVESLSRQLNEAQIKLQRAEGRLSSERDLDEERAQLERDKQAFEIEKTEARIRLEMHGKMTAAMESLVKTVFEGPAKRFAFDLYGNASGITNAQGMMSSPNVSLTGKLDTEGDDG